MLLINCCDPLTQKNLLWQHQLNDPGAPYREGVVLRRPFTALICSVWQRGGTDEGGGPDYVTAPFQ